MTLQLSTGAIQAIINGDTPEKPILQIISYKKISSGASADRYRLLLSDGQLSYSHAMLATQLNEMMEEGRMDNLCVVQIDRYLCNTIHGDRRVIIILDLNILQKGSEVRERLGNPQQYKSGGDASAAAPSDPPAPAQNGQTNNHGNDAKPVQPSPYNRAPLMNQNQSSRPGSNYSVKPSSSPSTPNSSRVHPIVSLTPYQNRWRIRARVTQKSGIRTWSNSRGEGKVFSVTLTDETGEIKATGFTDVIDKFYEFLEMNKVYYISRATLKTANKQYSSVKNDYEMTFNNDTCIELCTEDVDLPSMSFDFVKIDELEKRQANDLIDVIGVVKVCADVSTVIGRQSQKEITKRDLTIVDQSGMSVNLTLWGSEASSFSGNNNPIIAVKGARLSDFGGRSLSVLASSQLIINPDIKEAHLLRGWFDRDGHRLDFDSYRSDTVGAGHATNWKHFGQVKSENLGNGDKPDYFTSKGTVVFMRKENCMYKACPTEQCNKKLVDQGNGLFRCEKCNREFPNYKWRMILSANLADFADNQWVTCFQESAETLLGHKADELGHLRETNEAAFDQIITDSTFKSYIFKLRAKMETYNDESRLKTVCVTATPMDWKEYGKKLIEDITRLTT
ncbi:replication protein A 70 kDa DNA-binding subunit-like [Gigantopelta aegis]|uniref:replication protein A 70 kDa DNA-binding subunit-like n=1 Tax=Gigantopelta aegis TaxID=1735272 RepID=UPI001B88E1E7|nr:replication protein A 70 kDa DNA-binding subunit-like [Gigantopelta aegis]